MRFGDILGGLFGRKTGTPKAGAGSTSGTSQRVTPSDPVRQEKLRQDAAKHQGILNQDFARELERADEGWVFPESPDEPLMYLGNLDPLGLSAEERKVVREWTRELLEERGERSVWNSRLRLKLELRYLASEDGLRKGIGRFSSDRSQ